MKGANIRFCLRCSTKTKELCSNFVRIQVKLQDKMNVRSIISISILLLGSCKKEDASVQYAEGWEYGMHTSTEVRKFLSAMAPLEQVTTIDPTIGNNIITEAGINLYVPYDCFKDPVENQILSKPVIISVQEYFSNRDLLTAQVSTATEEGGMLRTYGALHITIIGEKSTEVAMRSSIRVQVPGRGKYNANHQLFSGQDRNAGNYHLKNPNMVVWKNDSTLLHGSNGGYQFVLTGDSWWNIASALPTNTAGMSDISVKLPAGYGNKNTMVAVLLPETGVIQLAADPSHAAFVAAPYQVPVGTTVKILSISKVNGTYTYDYRTITTGAVTEVQIESMKSISESSLKAFIAKSL